MSNEDRRNRSDRLKRRFERGSTETADTETGEKQSAQVSKKSKTEQSDKTAQTDELEQSEKRAKSESVKDRPSVLMYLPEGIHQELDIRFDELNAKHKRAHGEKLEKNRHYYPAIVKAGLEGSDVEDVLDI
jgi:hypothetical protein